MEFHVFNHPLEALSVAVIPGAETSSLLWPQVNHLPCHVSWVSNDGCETEGNSHEDCLHEIVTNIIVNPEQEELIFQENVEVHISCPEQELVHSEWETSLKQIAGSLFKWDSAQGLGG